MRYSACIALAAGLASSFALTAQAQERLQVGVLECGGDTTSFVVGSITELGCVFRSSGGPSQPYSATIRRFGVDIGINQKVGLAWTVFAPTRRIGYGELAGSYVGGAASATFGVGIGANALIGGSNNTIALQPLSLQGQTGLSVAAGVAGLELRPAPRRPPPPRRRHR
jgi:hypothetical protein